MAEFCLIDKTTGSFLQSYNLHWAKNLYLDSNAVYIHKHEWKKCKTSGARLIIYNKVLGPQGCAKAPVEKNWEKIKQILQWVLISFGLMILIVRF